MACAMAESGFSASDFRGAISFSFIFFARPENAIETTGLDLRWVSVTGVHLVAGTKPLALRECVYRPDEALRHQ